MVDCFDRIHQQLAETVRRPLKRLEIDPALSRVTIRLPGRGRSVHLTVSKSQMGVTQVYSWSAREDDAVGRTWTSDNPHSTPEAAYWAAVDTVGASRRSGRQTSNPATSAKIGNPKPSA